MATDQHHDLREALGEFFTAKRVRDTVRPEIAASWQRSVATDLRPDRLDVPYEAVTGEAERLRFVARPILEQIVTDFASSMSLVLTTGAAESSNVSSATRSCVHDSTGSCWRRGFVTRRS